jgi:hypothetical protein
MTARQPTIEEETRYYAGVLRQAIRAAGFSVSEVERRLGLGPKALRRVFGGQIDFKFRHMVAVLRIIGMSQDEFLTIAVANRQKVRRKRIPGSEFLEAFKSAGYPGKSASMPEDGEVVVALSGDDYVRMVEDVVDRVMRRQTEKGLLPPAQGDADEEEGDGKPD